MLRYLVAVLVLLSSVSCGAYLEPVPQQEVERSSCSAEVSAVGIPDDLLRHRESPPAGSKVSPRPREQSSHRVSHFRMIDQAFGEETPSSVSVQRGKGSAVRYMVFRSVPTTEQADERGTVLRVVVAVFHALLLILQVIFLVFLGYSLFDLVAGPRKGQDGNVGLMGCMVLLFLLNFGALFGLGYWLGADLVLDNPSAEAVEISVGDRDPLRVESESFVTVTARGWEVDLHARQSGGESEQLVFRTDETWWWFLGNTLLGRYNLVNAIWIPTREQFIYNFCGMNRYKGTVTSYGSP